MIRPVGAIAVGLVTEMDENDNIKEHKTLLDIIGSEDFYGDMDFKLCGTSEGITGYQLDLKLPGIPLAILEEAVAKAAGGREKVLREVDAAVRPAVEGLGYELVDLQLGSEYGRWVLRLLVDRPGGITLQECAQISREVSPHLDVADAIPSRYALEVSSPGVRRPLKRAQDFDRFLGEKIAVRTREAYGVRFTERYP